MENIMNKIAEWLQVSVEKAIELYPQLRTEAVWYTVTQSLFYILIACIVVSLIVTAVCWIPTIEFPIDSWKDIEADNSFFSQGNIFPTREAAELESKRRNLLTRFRAFRDECNGDWKVDWSKQDIKYFLSYSQKFDVIYTESICIRERFNLFGYFKNEKDAERAIELFGDEIKRLFIDCECD